MLEDNLITLESVYGLADHILASIPSQQLQLSDSPSLAATMTQTLASPAHLKNQELINLVLSMNNALKFKDQVREEQQADFHTTLEKFQHDQLWREEDVKQDFQQQEDRLWIKDLEDSQQQNNSRIKDLEGSLLEEKKIWVEEREAREKEKTSMLMRIQEIEDEHIETTWWVSSADTKLLDRVLLHHLLNLAQVKLATMSGLPKCENAFCIMQSFLWREALASSQTTAECLQTTHTLLNVPGTSLDAATKDSSHPPPG
ncbi:uncharacterized protein BJ212DRAFT_1487935 [Suillus subaureus]|uniref:Uncharacterized protein n=1 Tax=Suillus subaureus TaxID=48587 RepID=A0A9P7DQJ6_9AGAM|nr:uncharacterized protein BJ212DRAFT_1487935 [Suillus subaureus]KAG1800601.1 hypothetical protein BJ212DRAFT_1487935 [Suillus subaureus]